MTKIDGLSQYDKACLQVGRYINGWSTLESDIILVLHIIYKLNFTTGSILTSNITLGGKVLSLRAAIAFFSEGRMTEAWREEASGVLTKISTAVADRNRVAHQHFEADDEGGVIFYGASSKSLEFKQTKCVWSQSEFLRKCDLLEEFGSAIFQLLSELKHDGSRTLPPRLPTGLLNPLTPLFLEDRPVQ